MRVASRWLQSSAYLYSIAVFVASFVLTGCASSYRPFHNG